MPDGYSNYSSVKRYGLEGNESMIPALDTIFSSAATSGVSNIVIGMPHRGRLNLLVGLLKVTTFLYNAAMLSTTKEALLLFSKARTH